MNKVTIQSDVKRIHMMGILGSGMSGVASLASKMGYKVTGCDLKTGGHSEEHLKDIDLLVVSPAILYQSQSEPEFIQAKARNIVITWEEFAGKYLMNDKIVIAVSGTHGKSTTTAMVGKILEDNGFDPLVIIGANVKSWNGSSRYGKGKYFIIEADEFNDNFLYYHPNIIVLNNIEFDHPDYFKDEKQLKESFDNFIKKLRPNGVLIRPSQELRFNLKIFGEHNQKNANMAFQVGKLLNIPESNITKSLENFEGIGRRMEEIGKNIYDDYAHHPTAIKTTLAGLREKYKKEKILAVIEPHGYKRTKALLPLYKNVFDAVDEVIIGPIFKARDKVDKNITIEQMAKVSEHPDVKTANSIDQILEIIKKENKPNDILVVMGAGESNIWAKQISEILHR